MDEFEKLAATSELIRLSDPEVANTVRATLRLLHKLRAFDEASNAHFVARFQRDALAAIDAGDWPRLARVMLNMQETLLFRDAKRARNTKAERARRVAASRREEHKNAPAWIEAWERANQIQLTTGSPRALIARCAADGRHRFKGQMKPYSEKTIYNALKARQAAARRT